MNKPIMKKNIISMTKYQLMTAKNEGRHLPIIIIGNLLLSILITQLNVPAQNVGSIDVVVLSMALFLAPASFMYSFRLALMNGVSRKTTMKATLLSFAITSLILAITTVIFMYISGALANTFDISKIIFPNSSPIKLLPWLFAVLLFLGVFPTFLLLFLNQTRKKVKLIAMTLLFLLSPILILLNILLNGAVGTFFSVINRLIFGVINGSPNPLLSAISFLTLSIIFSVGIYFFGRRYVLTKK